MVEFIPAEALESKFSVFYSSLTHLPAFYGLHSRTTRPAVLARPRQLVITHISGWEFDISIFAMSFDGQALRLCCQMAEI